MQKMHGLTIQDPQAGTRKTPETAHGLDSITSPPSKNQNDNKSNQTISYVYPT